MEMKVEVKASTPNSSQTAVQKTFEEAILCFINSPPQQEKKAFEKLKEIIEFVSEQIIG